MPPDLQSNENKVGMQYQYTQPRAERQPGKYQDLGSLEQE